MSARRTVKRRERWRAADADIVALIRQFQAHARECALIVRWLREQFRGVDPPTHLLSRAERRAVVYFARWQLKDARDRRDSWRRSVAVLRDLLARRRVLRRARRKSAAERARQP